jgi:hypothetical protein
VTITGYIDSYNTEYGGQDRSCGNSIANVDFMENWVRFTFYAAGEKELGMSGIEILYPDGLDGREEIEGRIRAMLDLG